MLMEMELYQRVHLLCTVEIESLILVLEILVSLKAYIYNIIILLVNLFTLAVYIQCRQ